MTAEWQPNWCRSRACGECGGCIGLEIEARTSGRRGGRDERGLSHHPPRTICGTTCCTTPSSKGRVDLIEIDMQRVAGWPDFHPEDYCHRCGGRNVYSWHAPDDVWNRLRAEGLLPDSDIVCPQCFTDLARRLGVEPSVWHLIAEVPHA